MRADIRKFRVWLLVTVVLVVAGSRGGTDTPATAQSASSKEWPTYGHDAGGQRFSPASQITSDNVGRLSVAWVYRMRPPAQAGAKFASSEVTPLVANGLMYIATPYGRVVAVDPTTGAESWVFQLPSGSPSTRGVEVLAR